MKIDKNNKPYKYVKGSQRKIASSKPRLRPSPLAKKVLLKGENLREFEELRQEILSETQCQTKIENVLCEKIIFTLWKLRRAAEVERNLLDKENELTFEEKHDSLRNPWDPPPRRRITNIHKVRMGTDEVKAVIQLQIDLEKQLQKLLSRLRAEQKLRKQAENDEK